MRTVVLGAGDDRAARRSQDRSSTRSTGSTWSASSTPARERRSRREDVAFSAASTSSRIVARASRRPGHRRVLERARRRDDGRRPLAARPRRDRRRRPAPLRSGRAAGQHPLARGHAARRVAACAALPLVARAQARRSTSSARRSACSLTAPLFASPRSGSSATRPGPSSSGRRGSALDMQPLQLPQVPDDESRHRSEAHRAYIESITSAAGVDERQRHVQARRGTTRSRRSGAGCARRASTSCRSSSTSSAARCRSSARAPASRTRPRTSSRTTSSASSFPQGITGLWQVSARANSTFGEALEMDVAYVRGWSFGARPPAAAPDAVRASPSAAGDGMSDPVRVAVVGLGYWGPNLVRNLARARRAPSSSPSATSTTSGSRSSAAAIRPCVGRATSPTCLDADDVDAVADRDARLDPPSARPGRALKPASTSSSRSRSRRRRRRRLELVALAARARARPDAGPHVPLQPAGRRDPRPDRRRASSASSTSSRRAASTSGSTSRTSASSGTSRPHDFSILRYWLGETPTHVSATEPRLRHPGDPGRRVHQPRVRLGPDRPRRALLARAEQAAPDDDRRLREDGRLRRHEQRAGAGLRLRRASPRSRRRSASTG